MSMNLFAQVVKGKVLTNIQKNKDIEGWFVWLGYDINVEYDDESEKYLASVYETETNLDGSFSTITDSWVSIEINEFVKIHKGEVLK
jgi:hypothetical protein